MAEKLNKKQQQFCELYISEDKNFFGNGVECYAEAYGVDLEKKGGYKTAAACASRLLKNDKICDYINKRLEEEGLNDNFVDKQLKFLITQHADFKSKLGAIKEYNALKRRVTQNVDITSKDEQIYGEEQIRRIAERVLSEDESKEQAD